MQAAVVANSFFHRVMHSILTTGAGLPKLVLHHAIWRKGSRCLPVETVAVQFLEKFVLSCTNEPSTALLDEPDSPVL